MSEVEEWSLTPRPATASAVTRVEQTEITGSNILGNVRTGRQVHTSSAYLVYVALDGEGKPRPVPPVVAEDEEQRQRQHEAKLRREARLARKRAILAARAARGEA